MLIDEITSVIAEAVPPSDALSYDNVGLLVGSGKDECRGVVVSVDATPGAVEHARERGANLIVCHHPLIFNPLKSFDPGNYVESVVAACLRHGISVYAAHTNLDRSPDNPSARLLADLGSPDAEPFLEDGSGAAGTVPPMTLGELEGKIAGILQDNRTFTVGDPCKTIRKVSAVNGAGADAETLRAARAAGADVLISSEFKHHVLLEAREIGPALVSVGHYASEAYFDDIVSDMLKGLLDADKIHKFYEGNPYN